jgi:succinate-semialdehyde dehydrogenase
MRAGAGRSDPLSSNDADLDLAVKAAVAGAIRIPGRCAAAKRFIVEEGCDAFTQRFVAAAALKMGAPDQEENYVGPMARFDLRDELHQQVQAAKAQRFCWAVRKSR